MKRSLNTFLLCSALVVSSLTFGQTVQADETCKPKLTLPKLNLFQNLKLPNLGLSKASKVPANVPAYLAPYDQFDLIANCQEKPEKVVQTKTVELRRIGFQKWEEHCCGIKMKANYMKVTYQTFYSDGTSVVWDREYRS